MKDRPYLRLLSLTLICTYLFLAATALSVLAADDKTVDKKVQASSNFAKQADEAKKRLSDNEAMIDQLKVELTAIKEGAFAGDGLTFKLIVTLIILVSGFVLFLLTKFGVRKLEKSVTKEDAIIENDKIQRVKTLGKLIQWLSGIFLTVAVIYMILENFGVNVAPLLAGAGIVGLAFGFGGQYLIRDLINGLFIIVEGQYSINDVVKIGEYGGLVEGINLRITTLRDLAGRVIIVPNGEIKTVVNFTKEYAQALLNLGVAYKENVDEVMDTIRQVGKEMQEDDYFGRLILDDLEMLGVDDFADSQVTIKFRIKTLPIKQWEVSREFRRRIKNRFDEMGIEIPFPHRTLYWGSDKDNDWMKALANKDLS